MGKKNFKNKIQQKKAYKEETVLNGVNISACNHAELCGTVKEEPKFSHEIFGEGFYEVILNVERISENSDDVPCIISERLVSMDKLTIGTIVNVIGEFRSFNRHDGQKNRLILSLFTKYIKLQEEDEKPMASANSIYLDGYICKVPTYRTTPRGREITDVLIAVNRAYGKSDYIPCISWGRNARFLGNAQVGDHIQVTGRIQSRLYEKKEGEEIVDVRTAYEVSITKVDIIDNNTHQTEEEELTE